MMMDAKQLRVIDTTVGLVLLDRVDGGEEL